MQCLFLNTNLPLLFQALAPPLLVVVSALYTGALLGLVVSELSVTLVVVSLTSVEALLASFIVVVA